MVSDGDGLVRFPESATFTNYDKADKMYNLPELMRSGVTSCADDISGYTIAELKSTFDIAIDDDDARHRTDSVANYTDFPNSHSMYRYIGVVM